MNAIHWIFYKILTNVQKRKIVFSTPLCVGVYMHVSMKKHLEASKSYWTFVEVFLSLQGKWYQKLEKTTSQWKPNMYHLKILKKLMLVSAYHSSAEKICGMSVSCGKLHWN